MKRKPYACGIKRSPRSSCVHRCCQILLSTCFILVVVDFVLEAYLAVIAVAIIASAPRQHPFCEALAAAEKPLILYGSAVLERDDAESIVKLLKSLNAQTKVKHIGADRPTLFGIGEGGAIFG